MLMVNKMTYKIGVFGSAVNESAQVMLKAKQLGQALGSKQCVVITGACSGLPYVAAKSAHQCGAEIVGYSPVMNIEEQRQFTPDDDITIYKEIYFIPENFVFKHDRLVCKKYRNVMSTANCDAGVIIAGRWGTMNEFSNLFDMGKIIGVITETSGIANELPQLVNSISKETGAQVIFNNNPMHLIEQMLISLKEKSL